MKSLRTFFSLLFAGLCFVIAFGTGIMIFLQYRAYIKESYTAVIENSAHAVERLFPGIKNMDDFLAEGNSRSQDYLNLVLQINEIAEAYNFAYIYYLLYDKGNFLFVIDTDEESIESFYGGTFDEHWLMVYEDAPDEAFAALTQKTFTLTQKPYTDEWGTFVSGFHPLLDDSGTVVGVLGVDYDVSRVQDLEHRAAFAFGISLIIAMAAACLISLRAAASITKPINEVAVAANTLSQMRFDIKTSKLRNDEIGMMQRALYAIRDTLRQTMGEINNEQLGKQLNISRNLNQIIKRSTDELQTISSGMDLLDGTSKQEKNSVQKTADAAADIIKSIELLNRAVESQSESITSSAHLIEEMVKGIHNIQNTVHDANRITETLGDSSKTGRKNLEQLAENLTRIAERSVALEKANETIASIASQTNILAMNAAIEAAHAGETGKGFAVVSSEIRKLAVLSNQESESISAEIKNMAGAINEIRQVSGHTVESMNNIFNKLSDMNASFAGIKSTIEMQAVNGNRILESLKTIRDMANEVNNGSGKIRQDSDVIDKTVRELKTVSEEVGRSVNETRQAGKQMADSFSMAKKIEDGKIIIRPGRQR